MKAAGKQVRIAGIMVGAGAVLAKQLISRITLEETIDHQIDLQSAVTNVKRLKKKRSSHLRDQGMRRLNKRVQV